MSYRFIMWDKISLIFRLIILQKPLKTSLISLQELLEDLTGILRTWSKTVNLKCLYITSTGELWKVIFRSITKQRVLANLMIQSAMECRCPWEESCVRKRTKRRWRLDGGEKLRLSSTAAVSLKSRMLLSDNVLLNGPGSVAPFLLIDHIKQKWPLRTAEESAHTAVWGVYSD